MNRNEFDEKILDYLDGALSAEERIEFERMIETDSNARRSFDGYRDLMRIEAAAAAREIPMPGVITERVLRGIEGREAGSVGWLERWRSCMEGVLGRRAVFGGAAGLLVLVLCLKLGLDTSPEIYQIKRDPPQTGQITPDPVSVTEGESVPPSSTPVPDPLSQITESIQPGFRAVTIDADISTGIEGWAIPGTRVDVVATSRDSNGTLTSRIISQNARVLSMGGTNGRDAKSTLALSTSPSDANAIERSKAKNESLSLMLRSSGDMPATGAMVTQLDVPMGGSPRNFGGVKGGKGGASWRIGRDRINSLAGSDGGVLRRLEEGSRVGAAPVAPPLSSSSSDLRLRSYELNANSYETGVETGVSSEYLRAYESCSERARAEGRDALRSCVGGDRIMSPSVYQSTYLENERIPVSREPMSTFSIDVDTASYSQTRRALLEGRLPNQESVRIEEFLNYFDYDYPVQSERPFTLSYEAAPSPLDSSKVLLKLGIKAKDVAPYEGGWNLVFLVDVSGSMSSEDKLPLVKRALEILVDRMRPEDRVAIVTYAGASFVALPSTPGTEKARIRNAIASLSSGGGTNGSGGIIEAYRIAEQYKRKGAVNRIILATDGDFNVGMTSQGDLIRLIEAKRRSGITLTTIGVGMDNLKDGMLEQLADKGNGNYFYLDSLSEARKVMGEDLTKNVEVIAKDVKLQIEFNPEYVSSYRLVGYDNRKLANHEFNNDAVDAGEIGAGHSVTALYELVLKGSEGERSGAVEYRYRPTPAAEDSPQVTVKQSSELAFLKIRYKEPEGDSSKLLQYPIESANVQKSVATTSDDFRFAAAVSYFGTLLRGSVFAGTYTFGDIAELAGKARGKDERGSRREFVELVRNAEVLKREQQNSATRSWAE